MALAIWGKYGAITTSTEYTNNRSYDYNVAAAINDSNLFWRPYNISFSRQTGYSLSGSPAHRTSLNYSIYVLSEGRPNGFYEWYNTAEDYAMASNQMTIYIGKVQRVTINGKQHDIGFMEASNSNTHPNYYTCDAKYTYGKGAYIQNVTAEQGTYPQNARHTDGFWYVYQGLETDVKSNIGGAWLTVSPYANVNGIWKPSDDFKANAAGVYR